MRQNIAEFTDQFGIILFVEKFHECERFYAEMIGLRILYRAKSLMEAVVRRDSDAMAAIYERYGSMLRAVISSILHEGDRRCRRCRADKR